MPQISVIVVTWNRRELLRACLCALKRQTHHDFEVVVVDNASSDGSAEMAEHDFGARVLRNEANLGFCAANNQGIAVATGELIALLNNDAEPEPDWLRELQTAFTDRAIGMAASKVLVWEDPSRIDKAGHIIYPDGQNRGRGTGAVDRGQFDRTEEVLWPDGCAAMYRKEMLDRIGGFDEDFFAYGDDAELGLRARIAGWRCLYVPTAVVRHHRGSSLGMRSQRRLELIERNRVLLAMKLFPARLLLLNPFYFTARLLAGVWAAAQGRGDTSHYSGASGKWIMAKGIVMGDLQALRMLPRIWRKRAEVDAIRKLSASEVCDLIFRHRATLRELT